MNDADRQAHDSSEKVQSAAAKTRFDQSRTQANFGCLVLGRDCVKAGFQPMGTADQLKAIAGLRAALG